MKPMSDKASESAAEPHITETEAYKRFIERAEELAGHVLLNKEIGIPENGTGAHAIACELVCVEKWAYQKGREAGRAELVAAIEKACSTEDRTHFGLYELKALARDGEKL